MSNTFSQKDSNLFTSNCTEPVLNNNRNKGLNDRICDLEEEKSGFYPKIEYSQISGPILDFNKLNANLGNIDLSPINKECVKKYADLVRISKEDYRASIVSPNDNEKLYYLHRKYFEVFITPINISPDKMEKPYFDLKYILSNYENYKIQMIENDLDSNTSKQVFVISDNLGKSYVLKRHCLLISYKTISSTQEVEKFIQNSFSLYLSMVNFMAHPCGIKIISFKIILLQHFNHFATEVLMEYGGEPLFKELKTKPSLNNLNMDNFQLILNSLMYLNSQKINHNIIKKESILKQSRG